MGGRLLFSISTAAALSHALLITPGLIAPAGAQSKPAPSQATEPNTRNLVGVWALTDNLNNLFNVRLYPDGKAVSTIGTSGAPSAGAKRLNASELRELGQWQPWGNGVRIDYSNGWTDWIYVGPEGLSFSAWQPGQNRATVPFNFGPAVKLSGPTAEVVGVYNFPPAQSGFKPYTASLLSNGLAFNDIDNKAGGVWRLDGSTVIIDWISGWRTTMSINPATMLELRHWAPGADRQGPETGGKRQGKRIN